MFASCHRGKWFSLQSLSFPPQFLRVGGVPRSATAASTCWKCRFLGIAPDPRTRSSGVGPAIALCLPSSAGDAGAHSGVRPLSLGLFVDCCGPGVNT